MRWTAGIISGVLIACFASRGIAATGALAAGPAPDGAAMQTRVRALTSPAFAGRGNGTPEALAVADTLARWFAVAGLVPAGRDGWFQDFTLAGGALAGRPGRNVVGRLPGRGALAGRWLVLGAHYDHLGRVRGDSTRTGFYPGADDNASGVAMLVELARLLASSPDAAARAVVFVAFAGEEDGLQGSASFARDLPAPRDSLDIMLNLDSVGRLREGRLYVAGVGTAAPLAGIVRQVNAAHGLTLEVSRGGWDAGDHVSFNALGVPVLFLFTGAHEQYHTIADDWPLVVPAGLAAVAGFAQDLAERLRARPGSLAYVPVGEPAAARGDVPREGGPRPALGILPEFVEGAGGVQIAGVLPGGPAAAAGLARGDVVVTFAGRAVPDLATYTRELYARAPGDTVVIVVRRDLRTFSRRVVLGARR